MSRDGRLGYKTMNRLEVRRFPKQNNISLCRNSPLPETIAAFEIS